MDPHSSLMCIIIMYQKPGEVQEGESKIHIIIIIILLYYSPFLISCRHDIILFVHYQFCSIIKLLKFQH